MKVLTGIHLPGSVLPASEKLELAAMRLFAESFDAKSKKQDHNIITSKEQDANNQFFSCQEPDDVVDKGERIASLVGLILQNPAFRVRIDQNA
ncbi:hypothetical protein BGZ82_007999 [Podila clonocystis]|nr:hypothetical protein BGZ82_007999 [Podila clonocystis]